MPIIYPKQETEQGDDSEAGKALLEYLQSLENRVEELSQRVDVLEKQEQGEMNP